MTHALIGINRSVVANTQYTASKWRAVIGAFVLLGCLGLLAPAAHAVPVLQLYIEGATYDNTTESWVLAPPGSSAGEPFRLWAIGNVGNQGTIHNVRMSMVYDSDFDLVFTITPSTTENYGGFTDPSTPIIPDHLQTVVMTNSNQRPVMTGGKLLPPHGAYVVGKTWQEFALGNFDKTDSPIGDFITSVPDPHSSHAGQINAYEISVTRADGSSAHGASIIIDLYDGVGAKNRGVFAPFSHNGEYDPAEPSFPVGPIDIVPLPAAAGPAAALLAGLGVIGVLRRRRRPDSM